MSDYAGATVLVVDNQEDVVDVYAVYLEDAGYEVRRAYNGGEALAELDDDVDVVLLDLKMPGMPGEEVLSVVRDRETDHRVVVVTSRDPDLDITDLPLDDYLTKPVGEDELLASVEQMLMLDEYDDRFDEYRSLTKRYATLKSNSATSTLEGDETFQDLKARREAARERLATLVTEFNDPEFTAAYREIHRLSAENGE